MKIQGGNVIVEELTPSCKFFWFLIVELMWLKFNLVFSSYMVDAANHETLGAAKTELHNLLDKPQLQGIPVLVLGNKRDLPNALDEKRIIEELYEFLSTANRRIESSG